jgi:hypothetical protein
MHLTQSLVAGDADEHSLQAKVSGSIKNSMILPRWIFNSNFVFAYPSGNAATPPLLGLGRRASADHSREAGIVVRMA